jgi:hypothetical protein
VALTPVTGDIQAPTDSNETIQVVPNDPGSTITIMAVSYAGDLTAAKISADGTSFTITIKNGMCLLYVWLFSPDKVDGSATIQQTNAGATTIFEPFFQLSGGRGTWFQKVLGL